MRASQTQKPQPFPLPLPPPPLSLPSTPSPVTLRRHRNSTSSSSSSSLSTASSFSPAPSPRTAATTTSVVPFSWERHPGIPKSTLAGLASSGSAPLPLPPPLRLNPRNRRQRRRRRGDVPASADRSADPFAAAFVECTREEGTDDADADVADDLWPATTTSTLTVRAGRPWRITGGGVSAFFDLYGCKSAMDVADGVFVARRAVAPRPGPGRTTRSMSR